ncbi:MAG: hypothetical protein KAS49_00125 [Candidatus Cloacimonetes bacterium]|nr:hypothetical protein [Candidatus Cloacimonadota bacterium]
MLLLLLTIFSIIQAEEVDREKYMPQKLIYFELPEDYPKELDELFEFYYDAVEKTRKGTNNDIKKYISNMPETQRKRYFYLSWLAMNSIPEYYCEYLALNYDRDILRKSYFSSENINEKSMYTNEQINNRSGNRVPSVNRINSIIKESLVGKYPEIDLFYYTTPTIWAKVKVLESEVFTVPNKSSFSFCAKLEILDPIGSNFPDKTIYASGGGLMSQWKLEEGKQYLVRINYSYPISQRFTFIKNSTPVLAFLNANVAYEIDASNYVQKKKYAFDNIFLARRKESLSVKIENLLFIEDGKSLPYKTLRTHLEMSVIQFKEEVTK